MNKLKQYFSLVIVFWGGANLSQSSLAQYWVPIQPPVPSHNIMFPRRDGGRSINNTPSYSGSNKSYSTPPQRTFSPTSGDACTERLPRFIERRNIIKNDDPNDPRLGIIDTLIESLKSKCR
jgi:hypothetical protein